MFSSPEPALYMAIAILLGSMVLGSIVRFIALRNAEQEKRRKRLLSLRSWWLLAILVSGALLAGRTGVCLLLTVASCIGWYELTRMAGLRPQDRFAIHAGYLLIAINYVLILVGAISLHAVFLPLVAPIVFAILLLMQDKPQGYIRSTGTLLWGMMFVGYGLSHAALLMSLPMTAVGPMGAAGWFLFIVILTECDDIFQAITGRAFGAHKKHPIAPVISPNKTWEGFMGGLLVILLLSLVLAPLLIQLEGNSAGTSTDSLLAPLLIALLISAAGFFGDINMSGIKRDAGVKDSSNLLPGIGGVIDRIDSLTMTAPVYVCFLRWWLA